MLAARLSGLLPDLDDHEALAVTRIRSAAGLPLNVLPGGDVRIEEDVVTRIASGEVVTLGDHGRHILLEQPHELFLPLEPVLAKLSRHGIVGILSHPERNVGILSQVD